MIPIRNRRRIPPPILHLRWPRTKYGAILSKMDIAHLIQVLRPGRVAQSTIVIAINVEVERKVEGVGALQHRCGTGVDVGVGGEDGGVEEVVVGALFVL